MSLNVNVSDMPLDQKFSQPLEEGVLRHHRQKNIHADRHCNSMTESATYHEPILWFKISAP